MKQSSDYSSLCEKLGLSAPVKGELLNEAFSHGSAAAIRPPGAVSENIHLQDCKNYQRLEFLGDSVLGLLAAELLYAKRTEAREGVLSKLRAELVSGDVFSELADDLDLKKYIRLGPSIPAAGPKIMAEAFEALCGAVFLSCGFETTKAVFYPILEDKLVSLLEDSSGLKIETSSIDPKSRLQEFFQTLYQERPSYQLVETVGPAHSPVFRVRCVFRGETLGVASAKSKKTAEKEAAKLGLGKLSRYEAVPAARTFLKNSSVTSNMNPKINKKVS